MSRKFDFDKYKAIVDYIKSSTGSISTSIENLVRGTIEMRANSAATIIKYSTNIKEVVIGKFSSVILSEKWIAGGKVSIIDNGTSKIGFSEDYSLDDDALIPPSIDGNLINKLKTYFVERLIAQAVIEREYDQSVDTFSQQDVPNVKFFNDNYITKQVPVFGGKVILLSDSTADDKSAVNLLMANKLGGTNKINKTVFVHPDSMTSDIVDIDSNGNLSIVSSIQNLTISSDVDVGSAPSEKSIVMSSNIDSVGVKKDLSNMKPVTMSGSGAGDSGVLVDQDAIVGLSTQGDFNSDIETISKECQPTYKANGIHVSVYEEFDVAKDINDMSTIQNVLLGDEDDRFESEYLSLYGIVSSGFSPTSDEILNSRGNIATTLKHVYDMVSARLMSENRDIFITNIEGFHRHQIASTLMSETSSPEFARRPIVESTGGDIGTIQYLKSVVDNVNDSQICETVIGGW